MTTEEAINCIQGHIYELCKDAVANKEIIIALCEYAVPALKAIADIANVIESNNKK